MKHFRMFYMLIACTFTTVNVQGKELLIKESQLKEICTHFMKLIHEGKTKEAFSQIQPYFSIPLDEQEKLIKETEKQLNIISGKIGRSVKYVSLPIQKISGSFIRMTYLQHFNNVAIKWVFVFYKPTDSWIIRKFYWDDEIESLFR